MLVRAGADVNLVKVQDGSTPLTAAAQGGHMEVVKMLVEGGADLSQLAACDGPTSPVFAAVAKRDAKLLRLLVTAGARAKP